MVKQIVAKYWGAVLLGLVVALISACSTSQSYQTRSYCAKNPDHCQKNQDIFISH